jgi:hypothetical protein
MPYRHKIQLVIELNRTRDNSTYKDSMKTPEIYELGIQSDITDVVL